MDPLSAVGLASNIVQFVDFASTLVSKGAEIYKSAEGSTAIHGDLRASTERLQALSNALQSRILIPRDEDEYQIVKIATECTKISAELAKALDELAATPNSRGSSAWKALQSVWKLPKIEETARRLEMYRNDLHMHLSKALLNQQSFIQNSVDDLRSNNEVLGLKSDQMLARFQFLKEDLLEALRSFQSGGWNPIASGVAREKMEALHAGREDIVKAADMLRELRFSRMTVRRHNIVGRHGATFDWVFDQTHAGQDLHFREWLEIGNGIYWITGNAGSGKSTLVKFIYLDPRTQKYLLRWVHNSSAENLIMADFFFWKPGIELERSQEGLLRALLYEVLRQWPEVMPQVLGERWRDWILGHPWSLSELRSAIKVLGQQEGPNKFCFFIDGLDEYMGQSHEIAQAVRDIGTSANIKICVSSRPWNVFESVFGSQTKALLRLHEHTQEDIRNYVHEVLGQHRVYQQLEAEDARYERVLHKIVKKAKGVFLWVFLVVRNLEETLPNEDTVESLERTVDEFPSELEPYFEQMLDTIARRYHEQSAAILLMAIESGDLLPLVLVAHIVPEDDKKEVQIPLMAHRHIHSSRKLRARLKANCGDLVTVVTEWSDDFEDTKERIDFLHRTVDDFLRTPSVRAKLQGRVPQPYNPSIAIIECSVRYLSSRPPKLTIKHPIVQILFRNAWKFEKAQTSYDLGLIDQCKTSLVQAKNPAKDFMEAVMFHGLYSYVDQRIDNPEFDATYALKYMVFDPRIESYGRRHRTSRMLRILFEHGADPNASMADSPDMITQQVWMQHTIWTAKVMRINSTTRYARVWDGTPQGETGTNQDITLKQLDAATCEIFLEYGASYDASLGSDGISREVLRRRFGYMPGQVERYEQLARQWRRRGMLSWTADSTSQVSQSSTPTKKSGRRKKAFSRLFVWLS
jgi:hypothetical protein